MMNIPTEIAPMHIPAIGLSSIKHINAAKNSIIAVVIMIPTNPSSVSLNLIAFK